MKTYAIRYVCTFTGYCFMRDEQTVTGTLDYLLCYFRFALLQGNETDGRVALYPQTVEALTDALNEAARVTGKGTRYYNESNV